MWTVIAFVVSANVAAVGLAPSADPAAVAEVAAGRRSTADVTWWGFDAVDSTAFLQAALDSGAREVVVPQVGAPWITTGLAVPSGTTLTLRDGAELQAKRGAFTGTNDCLLRCSGAENVIIRGRPTGTLRMWRADYADPDQYRKAEWRHAISIRSSRRVLVENLDLIESGGDGIYLGVSQPGVTNRDVTIRRVRAQRHYRQGISVISAEQLTIEDCLFEGTAGTAPAAGIDFEPNLPDEPLIDCVVRRCRFVDNQGAAILLALQQQRAASLPVSLAFEDCVTVGGAQSVYISTGGDPALGYARGRVVFRGCRLERADRQGVLIANKPADGLRLTFDECQIVEPGLAAPDVAPFVLDGGRGQTGQVGGIELRNTRLLDPLDRVPLLLAGRSALVGVADLTGELEVQGHDGLLQRYALTAAQLGLWNPLLRAAFIQPYPAGPLALLAAAPAAEHDVSWARLRGRGSWYIAASRGTAVDCAMRVQRVGTYAEEPTSVTVFAPSGDALATFAVSAAETGTLHFVAPETAVYRIEGDAGQHTLALGPCNQPMGLASMAGGTNLLTSSGELWLWCPPGVREFAVDVFGSGTEGVWATLTDEAGSVIETQDDITAGHSLTVRRPTSGQGATYRLRLDRPSTAHFEDYAIALRGLPLVFAADRDSLLGPATP